MVEVFLAAKDWNSETIGKFYKALVDLPDEEKCNCTVFLAQTLSKRDGKENIAAATEILEHAVKSYTDISVETKARIHWALGSILEYSLKSYKEAIVQYDIWKDLNSGIHGAYISIIRCLLMANNFKYSEKLEDCLIKSCGEGDTGSREERLYESIAQYIIFSKRGNDEKRDEYKHYAQAIVKADENFLPDFLFKPDAVKEKLRIPQKVRIYVKQMI